MRTESKLHGQKINPIASNLFFFFNDTATTEIYTLSLHDALPISRLAAEALELVGVGGDLAVHHLDRRRLRSEEHTSELQSQSNLVCRLLLEKKKNGVNGRCSGLSCFACKCGDRGGDPRVCGRS